MKLMTRAAKRRISYAYHCPGWKYEGGDKSALRASRKFSPDEYEEEMEGDLFCPGCSTNIERTPKVKDLFTNTREPFFRHLRRWKSVACYLRSKKPEGKRYNSWEEAKRAIDHEELSIISSFLQEKPTIVDVDQHDYDETPVEDAEGPLSDVPIGRHQGESFKLPSKISTVAGICRNFEKNLQKYFYLPEAKHAIRLTELLHDVRDLESDILSGAQVSKLYFGKITSSRNAGSHDASKRMTILQSGSGVVDFKLKLANGFCRDKGITDSSNGRIVMFYGTITKNGIGLAAENLAWGEIALLPVKYNEILMPQKSII